MSGFCPIFQVAPSKESLLLTNAAGLFLSGFHNCSMGYYWSNFPGGLKRRLNESIHSFTYSISMTNQTVI